MRLNDIFGEFVLVQDKEFKPENMEYLNLFLKFCAEQMDIKDYPTIRFLAERENPKMSTGFYDDETQIVCVLVGRRMLLDIMRSLAHELAHHKQNELDPNKQSNIQMLDTDIDSPYENDAAIEASNIMKMFVRKFPDDGNELYDCYEEWI